MKHWLTDMLQALVPVFVGSPQRINGTGVDDSVRLPKGSMVTVTNGAEPVVVRFGKGGKASVADGHILGPYGRLDQFIVDDEIKLSVVALAGTSTTYDVRVGVSSLRFWGRSDP